MPRFNNATRASPPLRSIYSVRLINFLVIPILSWTYLICCMPSLRFILSGTTSGQLDKFYLTGTSDGYRHVLVQLVWATSATIVLMMIFWVIFFGLGVVRYVLEWLHILSILIAWMVLRYWGISDVEADYIPSSFLKAVFHKIYFVHS